MTCTVCGGGRATLVFRSDASVFRCPDCSHVFSDPHSIVHPEIYGSDYYEQIHRNWFANPNIPLFGWIRAQLPPDVRSVLDAGCGKGAFLRYLREHAGPSLRLMGVDYSRNDLEPGIEYWQGDIAQMSGPERFDAVVSLAVIEHVTDPVAFARSLVARCSPQGVVVVMTLDNNSLLYAAARLAARLGMRTPAERLYSAHHLQHFTSRSLRATLEKAGLDVIELHRHNAPLAAIDVPAPNALLKTIFTAGVAGLFWMGLATGKTYLQTMVARRRD